VPLSDAEKQRARYCLGYPALSTAASLQFGQPALTQTNFLVESALNRLLESSLDQVRSILNVLDGIESKLIDAQDRLAATQLEDLHLREDETDKLEREYQRWGYRLSDILSCPVYPFSRRYSGGNGAQVQMVPVSRG
jgi:hypothetical protein